MKSFLIQLLLSVFILPVMAQTFTVDKGKEFTPPDASKWGGFAGENTDSFFLLRVRTKGRGTRYFVEGISKTTKDKKFETELPLEEEAGVALDPVNLDMRVMCSNEKVYVFFKGFVKEEKITKYFVKTLHADGKPGSLKEIVSGDSKLDINFYQSPDKTKILSIQTKEWESNRQVVLATMYNASDFSILWNKPMPDEYKSSPIQTFYYHVDNKGGVYFMMNYIEQEEPRIIGKGMGFYAGKDKAKLLVFPNKSDFTIDNAIGRIAEDGRFIYSGLYKHTPKTDEEKLKSLSRKEQAKYKKEIADQKTVGIFSYVADLSTSTVVSNNQAFPPEVSSKLDYAGGLLTAGAANKYYTASKLVEMDGSFYLIENHNYTISGEGVAHYEREFIITKINKAGSISWTKIFPKYTVNNLNTFNLMVHNSKLYLFYLEHPKNLEKSIENYDPVRYADIKNYNGSVVVSLEIDDDGSAVRKQIFENKGWCYDPQPFNILLEKDNSLLFRMINRDEERFDVLKVQ
ncbi:MAG: hypothetical protein M3R27_09675 [Bacteroidota bacterium]|nr:hypothetical protein [Bacteroidota bacterium]